MIAVLVLLVGLGWYTASSWLLSAVLCVPLIGVCAWLSRGGNPLVGPLLRIDLVRTARHGRLFLFRSGYALALLVVLYLLYARWFPDSLGLSWNLAVGPRIPRADSARFAESFFHSFLLAQLAAVFLFTPAYIAGIIAEEKDRRTLDYLFVSDLTDREIVFSKLASRLLHLSLLVFLTGLPVLMFLTFLGGIAPELVVAGFLANGFTMLSIAGTSLLCSVYAEGTLTALFGAYLLAAGHMLSCGMCCVPLTGRSVSVPLALLFEAAPVLTILISGMFNGWLMAVCCHWAILRMRPWYRMRASSAAQPFGEMQHYPETMPEIGDDPFIWRGRHFGVIIWHSPSVPIRTGEFRVLALAMCLSLYLCVCGFVLPDALERQQASELVRHGAVALLFIMILTVAIRAALSLAGERDKRTLESLLTLPVENRTILFAKWWTSFSGVRLGCWLLAFLGLIAITVDGWNFVTLPPTFLLGGVYMAFAASLGLWCSLACRTALRAVLWSLIVLLTLSIIPLTWGLGFGTLFSPPAALAAMVRATDSLPTDSIRSALGIALDRLMLTPSLVLYALAAFGLWCLTNNRFGPITGRMPNGRPPTGWRTAALPPAVGGRTTGTSPAARPEELNA